MIKNMFFVSVFLFMLFSVGSSSMANAQGEQRERNSSTNVSGKVIDENGHPIAHASVHAAGTKQFTLTNKSGSFTLEDVPEDSVNIIAAKEGYSFTEEPVSDNKIELKLNKETSKTLPRSTYPNPGMDRRPFTNEAWLSLNGTWSFDFDPEGIGEKEEWFKPNHEFGKAIRVPFGYQSLAAWGEESRASETLWSSAFEDYHGAVWYRRSFKVPRSFDGHATRLKIGATDWGATVWLDGKQVTNDKVGTGYGEIPVNLGNLKSGSTHTIAIKSVAPPTNQTSPYPMGKQMKQGGLTDIGGIWQSVWIEPVNKAQLNTVHVTPNLTFRGDDRKPEKASFKFKIKAKGSSNGKVHIEVKDPQEKDLVGEDTVKLTDGAGEFTIPVHHPQLWSPEHPKLYEIRVHLDGGENGTDGVVTQAGLRQIKRDWAPGHSPSDTSDSHQQYQYIYLNNHPYFIRGFLDQAYNPWGIYTYTGNTAGPDFHGGSVKKPEPGSILYDLRAAKQQGFNMARTHIKVNEPAYYYWADKLGLLVWQDLPNLPFQASGKEGHNRWEQVLHEAVARDYNHPSIVTWVLFNETWGVGNPGQEIRPEDRPWVKSMVKLTRNLDDSRLIVDNSPTLNGGHVDTDTDINDFHWYSGSWKEWKDELDTQAGNVYPGSKWNFTGSNTEQQGQPWMNAEFGSGADKFRMHTGLYRSYSKMSGYIFTELMDQEHELEGAYSYTRSPKELGYIDHNGRQRGLEMFNTPDTVSIMSEPFLQKSPGSKLTLPIRISHWSDLDLTGAKLHWKVAGTDAGGSWADPDIGGSRTIDPEQYAVTDSGDIKVNLPKDLQATYVWVWIEDQHDKTVAETYVSVDLSLDNDTSVLPDATTFDLASPVDEDWSGGKTDVIDSKKGAQSITGVGRGHFKYKVKVPDKLRTGEVEKATLVFEAASYSKMSELYRSSSDQVLGNPRQTYTNKTKEFPSKLTVSVNGENMGHTILTDDPFDARAIVGGFTGPAKLSYGYRVTVPLDANKLQGHKRITLKLASDGGGLALFGPGAGRYGLAPQIVPKELDSTEPQGPEDGHTADLSNSGVHPNVYVAAPDSHSRGGTAIVTIVNDTQKTMKNVQPRLIAPDSVTAKPIDDIHVGSLNPGEAKHLAWKVIPSSQVKLGQSIKVTAMATARVGDGQNEHQTVGRVDAGLSVGGVFNPGDYSMAEVDDSFDTDTSKDYNIYLPNPDGEPMPEKLRFGNGKLSASDDGPYYAIAATKVSPDSSNFAVIGDLSRFIDQPVGQNAFFLGLAKDAKNYVMVWNVRGGGAGVDVVTDGQLHNFVMGNKHPISPGERRAVSFQGNLLSLWSNKTGDWEQIYNVDIGDYIDLTNPEVRSKYTYAVGLRGEHGTLELGRLVGLSEGSQVKNADEIKDAVIELDKSDEFDNDQSVHALKIHLTAVSHFEKRNKADKVVKHMKGFKKLLDYQKNNHFISDTAYNTLTRDADSLIEKWQK